VAEELAGNTYTLGQHRLREIGMHLASKYTDWNWPNGAFKQLQTQHEGTVEPISLYNSLQK